ncbi:MAG: ACT domain-containing protein [Clostridia bacterium]|nr:ACT domain-containing protein [Clostridia bacterium]
MRAIVTVIGPDQKGIIAAVCALLASHGANIVDISQTVMKEFFTMTMLVDLTDATSAFDEIRQALQVKGEELGLSIRIQNEDIFNAMHKI